jgi:ubiquinone/menaquinone biosynthesis C-methylase UbiE
VLGTAERPTQAIEESLRLLKPGGRVIFLSSVNANNATRIRDNFADWAARTGLRLSPPHEIPNKSPEWLLGVATA